MEMKQTIMEEKKESIDFYNNIPSQEIQKFLDVLRKNAKNRRRRKTPSSKIKTIKMQDKTLKYVDRPNYQIYLDENFPGWSIEDLKCWTEYSDVSNTEGHQKLPVLFNVSLTLVIIEEGMKRRIPGIGSSAVSSKEFRNNTQLLKYKFTIAYTEAIKNAISWTGGFFDLRIDEEEEERKSLEPTPEQCKEFQELLEMVPSEAKDSTMKAWLTQNQASADIFLQKLKNKLKERTYNAEPK